MSASSPDPEQLARLGRAVRELRVREGVTPSELAACLGRDLESVMALEAGRLDPTYELLLDTADCLGVPAVELFARAASAGGGLEADSG